MSKIDEIKEALDDVCYPEHEFRGCCYALLGELERMKQVFVTIGNLACRQDDITLQEINRHVDDALESLD